MTKIGPKEAQRRALREKRKIKPLPYTPWPRMRVQRDGVPLLMEGTILTVSGFGLPQPIENAVIGKDGLPKNKKQRELYKLLTKRGRPRLNLTPEQRAERKRQQTRARVRKLRMTRKKGTR